jgi:hypothetical protein
VVCSLANVFLKQNFLWNDAGLTNQNVFCYARWTRKKSTHAFLFPVALLFFEFEVYISFNTLALAFNI